MKTPALKELKIGQIVWKQSLLSDGSAYLFMKFKVLGFNKELIICESLGGGSFLLGFDWIGHSVDKILLGGRYKNSGDFVNPKDSSDAWEFDCTTAKILKKRQINIYSHWLVIIPEFDNYPSNEFEQKEPLHPNTFKA